MSISAFSLATVNNTLTQDVVANEGDLLEICFVTSVDITRSTLEVGLQAIPSATDATINGMEIYWFAIRVCERGGGASPPNNWPSYPTLVLIG